MTDTVVVEAPARLHFGLLDLRGGMGRRFGGVGAPAPGVSVRVLPLTTRDPRRLLDDGQVDLAVGFFPAVRADLRSRRRCTGSIR